MKRPLKRTRARKGFNLIELAIVIAMGAVLTVAVGIFLADGQRSWNSLYHRVYGDSTVDSFAVHNIFDSICRRASMRKYQINTEGDSLEVYHWDSGSSASTPENYTQFYLDDNVLYVQHGKLLSGTWSPDTSTAGSQIPIASGVESVKFDVQGTSMQLFLTYQNENTMPLVCSTVRHND